MLGDDLAERIGAQADMAIAAAEAIDPARQPSIVAARDAVKDLQILVSTEAASHLGVTIGFSDADGDSSG